MKPDTCPLCNNNLSCTSRSMEFIATFMCADYKCFANHHYQQDYDSQTQEWFDRWYFSWVNPRWMILRDHTQAKISSIIYNYDKNDIIWRFTCIKPAVELYSLIDKCELIT